MKNLILKKINNLFLIFFVCYLSLGNLQRIQLANNLAVYFHDILILIFLIFNISQNKFIFIFKLNKYLKFLLIWILLGWVLAFFSGANLLKPILYFSRIIFYLIFIINLKIVYKANFINKSFLIFGLLILYFGFLQYFFLPDTRFLSALGWDDHYYRLISTLLDPNFTGIILVITFFLTQKIIKLNYLKLFLSLLLIIAILLTYSRASYLAFLSSLILLASIKIKFKQKFLSFIFYILFFAIAIFFLPKYAGEGTKLTRTASINARTNSITAELESLKTRDLIFGQGLFVNKNPKSTIRYSPLATSYHANLSTNSFIQIFIGTGLVGLVLFLIIILNFLKTSYQTKNFYLLAASIAILIHSLFNATLTYPFVIIMFLSIMERKSGLCEEKPDK